MTKCNVEPSWCARPPPPRICPQVPPGNTGRGSIYRKVDLRLPIRTREGEKREVRHRIRLRQERWRWVLAGNSGTTGSTGRFGRTGEEHGAQRGEGVGVHGLAAESRSGCEA